MADLADLDDYIARYGEPANPDRVTTLLGDASSLVRKIARQQIDRVVDDIVTLFGDGTALLFLFELPVVAVTEVTVDGVVLDPTGYRWRPWGSLRRVHARWEHDTTLAVKCTHGFDPVPDWIVALVCSMVQRATRPTALEGVQAQTTGSQTVSYVTSAAGVNLWVTRDEAGRLESLRGPVLA